MGVSSQGANGAAGGAASGAAMGATVGGPWGAVIGGVVGGVAGLVSGQSAAKKQKKALEQYNQQLRENAERNYQKIDIQEKDAAGSAREQLLDNNIDMVKQRAQIESIAAATGTAGGTLGTLVNDTLAEGGRNQGTIVDNYNRQMQGFVSQAEDVRKGAQAQMKSTSIEKPSAGDWIGLIAQTGTSAYSGVGGGLQSNKEASAYNKSAGANTKLN